jgi:hypothetical protein
MRFHHSSGVWGVVAVVAFLLPGIGVIAGTLLGVFDAGASASFALFGLGVVMVCVGAAASLWRIEVVIDRDTRTVTEKRWLVGFSRGESYDFDSIERIEVRRRPTAGADRFEVRLDAADGTIYIDEVAALDRARAVADEIAEFSGIAVAVLADESASSE